MTLARLAFAVLLCVPASAATIHVAPGGDDGAAGSADAPFATITRAQEAARELAGAEPVTVRLAAGRFEVAEALVFTPEDSGTADAPVVYEAAPGAEVTVSGGRPVTGWRMTGGRWTVQLPEVEAGDWYFSQLWVNGERRYRPRWPEEGYSYIDATAPSVGEAGRPGDNCFRFDEGDISPDWHNLTDVEILVFHNWSMSRLPLDDVNEQRRVVTLGGRTWQSNIGGLTARKRFLAENVFEALDDPGEWYLDRSSGVLTYIPMPGETPDQTEVIAPVAPQLVSIVGDTEAGLPVQHLHLRGITFEHANINMPDDGYCVAQAEVGIRATGGQSPFPSAVEATGARSCSLEGCTVRRVGYYAVEFGASCHDNAVVDCELYDLGGGGVKVGSTTLYPEGDQRNASGLRVEDCLIAHGGRMHPAAVGVWIGHSSDNQIVNNDIHDFYYTGVSVGWRWGWGWSAAKRNLISHNHMFDIGQRRLSDLGGIYTLGESEGTVLSYNRIHDVSRVLYGGSGIYHDQASMGILSENNVVYRTQDAGFTIHWGKDNTARNNIFAYGEEDQVNPGRTDLSGPITFERNIVLWTEGSFNRRRAIRDDYSSDNNIYWPGEGREFTFAQGLTLDEWRATGRDVDSVVADPGFADPENGDFTLAADSPALAFGFVPIDTSDIGRRTARRAPNSLSVPHAFPEAGPPPPKPIDEDFEFAVVGQKAPGAQTYENNETEVARVTDELARSGKQCLKLTDGPGEGPGFNPHIYYQPGFEDGRMVGGFDVWLTPGASFSHEWRDRSGPYKVGASIRVLGDGTLMAGNRELTLLPHNDWAHIEVTAGLGEQTSGTFSLTVALEAEFETFADLPADPECRELHWFGFVAGGTEPAAIYLDNITLRPVGGQ